MGGKRVSRDHSLVNGVQAWYPISSTLFNVFMHATEPSFVSQANINPNVFPRINLHVNVSCIPKSLLLRLTSHCPVFPVSITPCMGSETSSNYRFRVGIKLVLFFFFFKLLSLSEVRNFAGTTCLVVIVPAPPFTRYKQIDSLGHQTLCEQTISVFSQLNSRLKLHPNASRSS